MGLYWDLMAVHMEVSFGPECNPGWSVHPGGPERNTPKRVYRGGAGEQRAGLGRTPASGEAGEDRNRGSLIPRAPVSYCMCTPTVYLTGRSR